MINCDNEASLQLLQDSKVSIVENVKRRHYDLLKRQTSGLLSFMSTLSFIVIFKDVSYSKSCRLIITFLTYLPNNV